MGTLSMPDAIPVRIDITVPRVQRRPRTQAPVTWHAFAADMSDTGRDTVPVTAAVALGLYSPEWCIIDAFRLRHPEGPEVAVDTLRRWLRRRGSTPVTLLAMAGDSPKAEPALRAALKILL